MSAGENLQTSDAAGEIALPEEPVGEIIDFDALSRAPRQSRWHRPIGSEWDRFVAWMNMLFVDHAIFRAIWSNTWKISDRAWRASQPLPHHIRRFAGAGGKTVVTLRGGQAFGSLPLEIEACEADGLVLRSFVLRSRGLPSAAQLLSLRAFFDDLEYPVLFHCKSGADRAGLMAAMYLAIAENRPVVEARRQLGIKFGHIRMSKTGVLDALFDAYQADTATEPMELEEWIATRYDPDAITASFHASSFWSLIVDRVLMRE